MRTRVETVVAFGDSLTQGVGATKRYGWAQMLEDRFYSLNADQAPPGRSWPIFYNLAVINETSIALAERVRHEFPSRIKSGPKVLEKSKVLSIVNLGMNDSWLNSKTGKPNVSLREFAKNLGQVATTLAEKSTVLFVSSTSVDTPANAAYYGKNTRDQYPSARMYEEVALDTFQRVGAGVVSLLADSHHSPTFKDGLWKDGTHPGDDSHRWIYERVAFTFDQAVGIIE